METINRERNRAVYNFYWSFHFPWTQFKCSRTDIPSNKMIFIKFGKMFLIPTSRILSDIRLKRELCFLQVEREIYWFRNKCFFLFSYLRNNGKFVEIVYKSYSEFRLYIGS